MDLANTLIRSVVRAFYETRHILIVDALFIHSVYDPVSWFLFRLGYMNFDSNKYLLTVCMLKTLLSCWECSKKISGSFAPSCERTA